MQLSFRQPDGTEAKEEIVLAEEMADGFPGNIPRVSSYYQLVLIAYKPM